MRKSKTKPKLQLENFKNFCSTLPTPTLNKIGETLGIDGSRLQFRSFSDIIAERVWKLKTLRTHLITKYDYILVDYDLSDLII